MIRTQIYLPEDIYRDLKILSSNGQTNFSQLIRDGAREIIKKRSTMNKSAWLKFIGAAKTHIKTNATKDIHEYYKKHAI